MKTEKYGPNFKRLIAARMAAIANPRDVMDGVRFLSDPKAIAKAAREADEFAHEAIRVMRLAAEPNPWRFASDEVIAGEILRVVEERSERIRSREPMSYAREYDAQFIRDDDRGGR